MWQVWLGVVVALIIYSIVRGIEILHPPEMGVLVIFGRPVSFWDSGLHFCPLLVLGRLLGCYVAIFPKRLFNLNYAKKTVITKEGFYPEEEEFFPKGTKRFYGSQVLTTDPTAYLIFPRKEREIDGRKDEEHPLFEIFRSGIPTDEEGLLNWTEEAVSSAQRLAFGEITWREAIEKMVTVRERADQEFKDGDGALVRAGFDPKDIKLKIPEIQLPKKLADALPKYDEQRIESESAKFEAEQIATETAGAVMEAFCAQTGISLEKVQEALKSDKAVEFITKHKDPWERSWDIVYRRMAIDGKAYFDLRVLGGTKLEGLITLFKKIFSGSGGGEKKEERRKSKVEGIIEEEGLEEG